MKGNIKQEDWPDILRQIDEGEAKSLIARSYGVSSSVLNHTLKRMREHLAAKSSAVSGVSNASAVKPLAAVDPAGPQHPERSAGTEPPVRTTLETRVSQRNPGSAPAAPSPNRKARPKAWEYQDIYFPPGSSAAPASVGQPTPEPERPATREVSPAVISTESPSLRAGETPPGVSEENSKTYSAAQPDTAKTRTARSRSRARRADPAEAVTGAPDLAASGKPSAEDAAFAIRESGSGKSDAIAVHPGETVTTNDQAGVAAPDADTTEKGSASAEAGPAGHENTGHENTGSTDAGSGDDLGGKGPDERSALPATSKVSRHRGSDRKGKVTGEPLRATSADADTVFSVPGGDSAGDLQDLGREVQAPKARSAPVPAVTERNQAETGKSAGTPGKTGRQGGKKASRTTVMASAEEPVDPLSVVKAHFLAKDPEKQAATPDRTARQDRPAGHQDRKSRTVQPQGATAGEAAQVIEESGRTNTQETLSTEAPVETIAPSQEAPSASAGQTQDPIRETLAETAAGTGEPSPDEAPPVQEPDIELQSAPRQLPGTQAQSDALASSSVEKGDQEAPSQATAPRPAGPAGSTLFLKPVQSRKITRSTLTLRGRRDQRERTVDVVKITQRPARKAAGEWTMFAPRTASPDTENAVPEALQVSGVAETEGSDHAVTTPEQAAPESPRKDGGPEASETSVLAPPAVQDQTALGSILAGTVPEEQGTSISADVTPEGKRLAEGAQRVAIVYAGLSAGPGEFDWPKFVEAMQELRRATAAMEIAAARRR